MGYYGFVLAYGDLFVGEQCTQFVEFRIEFYLCLLFLPHLPIFPIQT